MLTKFHWNWSIPDIDCKQFKKVTFPRKDKAKDLSGTIKQIMFSNGKSHNLFERTFSFHFNPKKSCWEVPVTMQLSFKERCVFFSAILEREIAMGANKIAANSANFAPIFMFFTKLESWRHNHHFEIKFVIKSAKNCRSYSPAKFRERISKVTFSRGLFFF